MDGYAGSPHITETQIGLANQAAFGPDDYVLGGGRESEAQVLTNNSIRIFDAVYCIQGRRDVIPASGYTDVTIANGTQGMNRNDIIVRRYKKNESSEIESTEYAVIKGTPNAGTAVDPKVTTGDIRSGATLHEMALYRVKITGLNITAVEPMFNILKNMASLQKELAELNSKIISVEDKTVGQLKLKKSGNMVTATFAWSPAGVVAAHVYKLETIPDGFRPNQDLHIPGVVADGNNNIKGTFWMSIHKDGTIDLVSSLSHTAALSYITSTSWATGY